MTIVDSCIILDLAANDSFTEPAKRALAHRLSVGRLYAPDIVFAEVCRGYDQAAAVEQLFHDLQIEVVHLDSSALFRAAQAFRAFKKDGRQAREANDRLEKHILTDFLIGALAEEQSIALLTRDIKRRWRRYFPALQLVGV